MSENIEQVGEIMTDNQELPVTFDAATDVAASSNGNSIEALLQNPTLDFLRQYCPGLVPVVEEMKKEINPIDHMAIVTYGADALDKMAEAGLDTFATLQDDKGAELSAEFLRTQKEFQNRVAVLQDQIRSRAMVRNRVLNKGFAETMVEPEGAVGRFVAPVIHAASGVSRTAKAVFSPVASAIRKISDPKGEKALVRQREAMARELQEIDSIIQSQNEDSCLILNACEKTSRDMMILRSVLMANRNKPSLVFEQMSKGQEAARRARELAFLRLVALNEKGGEVKDEITRLREESNNRPLSLEEIDKLELLERGNNLMERRQTDLVGTVVLALQQIKKADIIKNTTADMELERRRQETQVVSTIAAVLGDLTAQHELSKLMATTQLGNQMQKEAMGASSQGLKTLLKQRAAVDQSMVDATNAIATSALETAKIIDQFAEHDTDLNKKMADSRKVLEKAAATLSSAIQQDKERRKRNLLALSSDAKTNPGRPATIAADIQAAPRPN